MQNQDPTREAIKATAPAVDLTRFPLGVDTSIDQREFAELIGVKYRAVETWRREGRGPKFFRVGIRPRYRLRDIFDWQRERVVGSTLAEAPGGQA